MNADMMVEMIRAGVVAIVSIFPKIRKKSFRVVRIELKFTWKIGRLRILIFLYAKFSCSLVDCCGCQPGRCLLPGGFWRHGILSPGKPGWTCCSAGRRGREIL